MSDYLISVKGSEIKSNDIVTIGGLHHFVTSTEPLGGGFMKVKLTHLEINYADLSNRSTETELTISSNLHFSVMRQ